MTKQEKRKAAIVFAVIALVFMAGAMMTGGGPDEEETIQVVMRDAVLHDVNKVSLFGLEVNPGLLAGFIVSCILILFALICRLFFIPKFTMVPGKFQLVLETVVGLFDNMSKTNSKIHDFLGAYIFAAGSYIFTGTLFGHSDALGVLSMT